MHDENYGQADKCAESASNEKVTFHLFKDWSSHGWTDEYVTGAEAHHDAEKFFEIALPVKLLQNGPS